MQFVFDKSNRCYLSIIVTRKLITAIMYLASYSQWKLQSSIIIEQNIKEFLSLQVIGSIFLIILMTYCFGNGVFWPTMFLVALHIIILAVSRIIFGLYCEKPEKNSTLCVHSILFGIVNLYCPTWIPYQFEKTEDPYQTMPRELSIQALCLMENIICFSIVMAYRLKEVDDGTHEIRCKIAIVAICACLFGLALKLYYLKAFHLWRDILWKNVKHGNFQPHCSNECRKTIHDIPMRHTSVRYRESSLPV